jgi:hypothetical protein
MEIESKNNCHRGTILYPDLSLSWHDDGEVFDVFGEVFERLIIFIT